jgi:hypothetical protein
MPEKIVAFRSQSVNHFTGSRQLNTTRTQLGEALLDTSRDDRSGGVDHRADTSGTGPRLEKIPGNSCKPFVGAMLDSEMMP